VKAFHSFSGGTCIAIATVNIVLDLTGKNEPRRGGEEEGERIKSGGPSRGCRKIGTGEVGVLGYRNIGV